MAGDNASPTISLRERSFPVTGADERLPKWVTFSLIVHCSLLLLFVVAPFSSSPRLATNPVYTVDLVGGERIGRTSYGTELGGPAKKEVKSAPTPAPIDPPKKEVRQEKADKPKIAEKKVVEDEKVALREKAKKEPPTKELTKESKSETKTETASADSVRERLIKAAAERASAGSGSAQKSSKGEALSNGTGEGVGGSALGAGGRGGPGSVRSIEFIGYMNRVRNTIRDNWSWVGQRKDLKVLVNFAIKENGEIMGIKILQGSGDPTYDDSVLRALRKSNPLPPPPENHRKDFSDYRITFTPEDLGA
jgi:colicin import membrane protein